MVRLQVYDEDVFSRDESLGTAEVSVEMLQGFIEAAEASGPHELELPLSTEGLVVVRVAVDHVEPPARRRFARLLWDEGFQPIAMRARAWFLVHRVPYDMDIFAKYRNWKCVLLTLVASLPNVYVRGAFFTLYLLAIS